MSNSTRYDQKPGVAYGVCDECATEMATVEESREHMDQTMAGQADGGRRSHRIRITNPTRDERIKSMVREVVQDAIEEALDELRDKIARADVSSDEITGALTWFPDFRDEWDRS